MHKIGICKLIVPALVSVILGNFSLPLLAESQNESIGLSDHYVGIEVVRNRPMGKSRVRFSDGSNTPFLVFRHVVGSSWIVGVTGGFKKFNDNKVGQPLGLMTISQESEMLFRLSAPWYFSIGSKLLYLLPTREDKIPPRREDEFEREMGAGITSSLYYALGSRGLLNIRIDRWRGVNTQKFQGTEVGVGFSWAMFR